MTPLRQLIAKNKWRLRPLIPLLGGIRAWRSRVAALVRPCISPERRGPRAVADDAATYLAAHPAVGVAVEVTPAVSAARLRTTFHGDRRPAESRGGESHPQPLPACRIHELADVDFWGHYAGTLIAADGTLLGDLSKDVWRPRRSDAMCRFTLPGRSRVAGRTCVVSTPEAAGNYWHWMVDLLPRLHLLDLHGASPASFDHCVINHTGRPYQVETLAALGIDPRRVLVPDPAVRWRLDRAVVPSFCETRDGVHPWKISFLRGLVDRLPRPGVGAGPASRIYVSRQRSTLRRLLNEDQMRAWVERHGFVTLEPEEMSVAEQADAFRAAEVVVAVHGAALTNICFCNPGTKVIEIASPNHMPPYYQHLSAACNLDHHVVVGSSRLERSDLSDMRSDDVSVDVRLLDEALAARYAGQLNSA